MFSGYMFRLTVKTLSEILYINGSPGLTNTVVLLCRNVTVLSHPVLVLKRLTRV